MKRGRKDDGKMQGGDGEMRDGGKVVRRGRKGRWREEW